MTEQELIERIDRLSGQHIVNMSNESLRMLTSDFKESLVRRVVAVGLSLRDQGLILDKLEETINEYNRCYYEYDPAWLSPANEAIQNIRFDLECGITIKVESEQNDFQNNMDDSAEFTPITIEELDKILSETEDSTTNENNTVQGENLKARIKELEEENEQLKDQLEQQKTDDNQEKNEELNAHLTASNDYIDELEKEIKELRDFKLEIEDLKESSPEERLAIDERAIFFSSAIGMDFDPKRTNQKQLSIMISTLSGDRSESIRGRISKMHKMEKNNRFSEEVLQAARNVKGLLEKVPRGNQPQKLKDIIDNIDLVFLNSNNS